MPGGHRQIGFRLQVSSTAVDEVADLARLSIRTRRRARARSRKRMINNGIEDEHEYDEEDDMETKDC
jgi:hypothetical protein